MTQPAASPRDGADLRVGLIGYGLAGSVFHAPFIAVTPGLRLAAVVTGSAERGRQVEREHPGAVVLDRVARLWDRAAELDVVVIASPNATHVPLALAALEAGLHVVVDKPFATSVDEARGLVQVARRRGRLIVPFHNRRWDGDMLTLQRLLRDGALGDVHRFESRFDRWRPSPKPRWTEPVDGDRSEGIVFDLGSHLVDQALVLFGPVRDVYAELDRRHPDVRVEDDAFIALTHESGVRSHLAMSTAAAQQIVRMRALGSRAAYVKRGVDPQEDALRAGGRPDQPAWGEEPAALWGRLGAGDAAEPVRTEPGAYGRFYAGLVDALRGDGPPPVAAEDAVAGLVVMEAAFESAESGRIVRLAGARA